MKYAFNWCGWVVSGPGEWETISQPNHWAPDNKLGAPKSSTLPCGLSRNPVEKKSRSRWRMISTMFLPENLTEKPGGPILEKKSLSVIPMLKPNLSAWFSAPEGQSSQNGKYPFLPLSICLFVPGKNERNSSHKCTNTFANGIRWQGTQN